MRWWKGLRLRSLAARENVVAAVSCALLLGMAFWILLLPEEQKTLNRIVPVRQELFRGLRLSSATMPGRAWASIASARTERKQVGFLSIGLAPELVLEEVVLTLPEADPAASKAPEPLPLRMLTQGPAGKQRQREFGSVRLEKLTLQWLRAGEVRPFLQAHSASLQGGEAPGMALRGAYFAETPDAPWEPLKRARIAKAPDGTYELTAFRRDGRALRLSLPLNF